MEKDQQTKSEVSAELFQYGAFTFVFDPNTSLCFMVNIDEDPSVVLIQYKRTAPYKWKYCFENDTSFQHIEYDDNMVSFLEHSYQKLIGALILGIST